jgi:hypothetical protein
MTVAFTEQDIVVIVTAAKKLTCAMLVLFGGASFLAILVCIVAYFIEHDQNPDVADLDPEYQKFVDEMSKHCHCQPPHDFPCAGVLAGGLCDGMGETQGEHDQL